MSSIKCAVCGQQYEAHDVALLGQEEEFWFLRMSCPICHTECLVAIATAEDGEPELFTDLNELEGRLRVTADDTLNMHNFLKDFDGDFIQLFERQ